MSAGRSDEGAGVPGGQSARESGEGTVLSSCGPAMFRQGSQRKKNQDIMVHLPREERDEG